MKKLKRITAKELKKARKDLGITQKRLAELFKKVTGKCSLRSVQSWEQGQNKIPLHIVIALIEIRLILKIKVKNGEKI